ncbi:hypothetical protein HK405_003480 [Cladochytrium tenue]|nr:hypothetical protein HK405_003480 [Cladochytrium tenue]
MLGVFRSDPKTREEFLQVAHDPHVRDILATTPPLFFPSLVASLDRPPRVDSLLSPPSGAAVNPVTRPAAPAPQSDDADGPRGGDDGVRDMKDAKQAVGAWQPSPAVDAWLLEPAERFWIRLAGYIGVTGLSPILSSAVDRAVALAQSAYGNVLRSPLTDRVLARKTLQQHAGKLSNSPIRALAWHRHCEMLAWLPGPGQGLGNEFQRDVTCLEWRPQSGTMIAVGCKTGVCIWRLLRGSGGGPAVTAAAAASPGARRAAKPSFLSALGRTTPAVVSVLVHPAAADVSCVAWSPDGRLLAVGSASSPAVVIWDVATEAPTLLRRGVGGASRRLVWSPSGRYLLQICESRTLRIWETDSFTSVDLETPTAFAAACWLADSRTVLFAVTGSARINVLQLAKAAPSLQYRLHPQAEKTPRIDLATPSGQRVSVGGPVASMEVDPLGQRLAVTFAATPAADRPGAELIALFDIRLAPLPQLDIIGFVRGPSRPTEEATVAPPDGAIVCGPALAAAAATTLVSSGVARLPLPVACRFAQRVATGGGALLAVAWGDGAVTFVPCML